MNEELAMEKFRRNRLLIAENIKRTRTEKMSEYNKRRKEVCAKCVYAVNLTGETKGICDYLYKTGMIRPCSGRDCVEKGVFKKR